MADYTSIAEVRAMNGMDDVTAYPDATITEAINFAEELIDHYTGTSWVAKAFSVTLTGNGSSGIRLHTNLVPLLFPLTITAATIDGVAVPSFAGWALYPEGLIIRDTGSFGSSTVGRNIVIAGTAGAATTAPKDVAWAARTLARQYVIDLVSRIPDRALQIQNDFGSVQIAQASTHPDRPTSLPEVNARLARRRQIPSTFSF